MKTSEEKGFELTLIDKIDPGKIIGNLQIIVLLLLKIWSISFVVHRWVFGIYECEHLRGDEDLSINEDWYESIIADRDIFLTESTDEEADDKDWNSDFDCKFWTTLL